MFHKKKLITKLIYLILPTVIICSYSPLGTSSTFYNQSNIKANIIGYYLFKVDYKDKAFGQKTDSIFNYHLSNNIKTLTGVNSKFLGYITSESDIEKIKTNTHIQDLIFISELNLIEMFNLGAKRRFNTTVRTFLIESKPKSPLIETKFNTNSGKTYWQHPNLEIAIQDRIKGAFRPYLKRNIINKET